MSLPQINQTLGGYHFTWEKEMLEVTVSRLKQHKDGRVTGEILITTSAPAYNPHLHQAQFNFSSTHSRRDLARSLEERYSKLADWDTILEQLCVYTLDRVRRGEPVVELWTKEDASPPEYLLEPLILRNYPTIIFGDPSTAKSTVALILTQVMMLPWRDNPLGLAAPERSVRCLFLDYETDPDTIRWLLTMLQRGMELPPLSLNYRHCALPLPQDIEQVRRHIDDYQAEVIIIDSLGLACGGDLKEAESALALFSALRLLRTTSLILAHTAKNPETKKKTVFGSVFFEAQARSIWEIRKAQDTGEDELDVALFHRKPPPFQKLCAPIGLTIKYGPDTMTISQGQPRSVAEFLGALGTQAQIEELLKDGPMSPKGIMEALDISRGAVDMALKRLKNKQKVVKLEDGKWGLLGKENI